MADHRYIKALQLGRVADAGHHQETRRVDRAGAENDFLPRVSHTRHAVDNMRHRRAAAGLEAKLRR
jgi:hypothetical protein